MSQLHTRICLWKPKRCQILAFNLKECIHRTQTFERPQEEIIELIIEELCSTYNVRYVMLRMKNRNRDIVKVRQIGMHLLKKNTNLTLLSIGEVFGGFDHTSVLHSINTVKDLRETYSDYSNELTQIETKIKYKL